MNTKIRALSIITLMTVANANLVAATDLTTTAGDVRDQVQAQREIYRDGTNERQKRSTAIYGVRWILCNNPNADLVREVLAELRRLYMNTEESENFRVITIDAVRCILYDNPNVDLVREVLAELRGLYMNTEESENFRVSIIHAVRCFLYDKPDTEVARAVVAELRAYIEEGCGFFQRNTIHAVGDILRNNPDAEVAQAVVAKLRGIYMNIHKIEGGCSLDRKEAIMAAGAILRNNPDAEVAEAVVAEIKELYFNGTTNFRTKSWVGDAVGLIALKNRDIIFGPKAIFPLEELIPLVSDKKIAKDLTNLQKTVKERTNLFAIYNAAWTSGKGKVPTDTPVAAAGAGAGGDSLETNRLSKLGKLLSHRRLCRTDKHGELVEPFGRAVAALLGKKQ